MVSRKLCQNYVIYDVNILTCYFIIYSIKSMTAKFGIMIHEVNNCDISKSKFKRCKVKILTDLLRLIILIYQLKCFFLTI